MHFVLFSLWITRKLTLYTCNMAALTKYGKVNFLLSGASDRHRKEGLLKKSPLDMFKEILKYSAWNNE